jgi:hypothetical protein
MLDATQPRPGAAGVHAAADLPFDKKHLDVLLEAANIDILLVTSKHNIQYMLGGYRFFFFDQFDAIGIARYLPIMIYPKGRPDRAVYVGNAMEDSEAENGRFWCPTVETDPGARWTPPTSRSITSGASCRRTPESELSFRSFPQMRWMHCDRDCPTARSSTLTCHWNGFEPSRLRTNWH